MWYDECMSDFIQTVPLLVQGFYKACKVLQRSGIENFVKYYVTKLNFNLDDINSIYELFETAKKSDFSQTNQEVKTRLDGLYQIYGDLCRYVHSSGETYYTFCRALAEYPGVDEESLITTVQQANQTFHIINGLLSILDHCVLSGMYHVNKDSVLDNLTAKEKQVIIALPK